MKGSFPSGFPYGTLRRFTRPLYRFYITGLRFSVSRFEGSTVHKGFASSGFRDEPMAHTHTHTCALVDPVLGFCSLPWHFQGTLRTTD